MESSPYKVKQLVLQFLSLSSDVKRVEAQTDIVAEQANIPSVKGEWLKKRRVSGALHRVPQNFYPKVWDVLAKSKGIKHAGNLLPRDPTVSEMTRSETNFALRVENILGAVPSKIHSLVVECLMTLAEIEEAQPSVNFDQEIEVDKFLEEAIKVFWESQSVASKEPYANKVAEATLLFCDLPSIGTGSTRYFIIHQIMKHFPNFSDVNKLS